MDIEELSDTHLEAVLRLAKLALNNKKIRRDVEVLLDMTADDIAKLRSEIAILLVEHDGLSVEADVCFVCGKVEDDDRNPCAFKGVIVNVCSDCLAEINA